MLSPGGQESDQTSVDYEGAATEYDGSPENSPSKGIVEENFAGDMAELRQGEFVGSEFGRYTHVVTRKPDPSLFNLYTFRRAGSVVVLIHGLGLCQQSWTPVEDLLLGKNYCTVSYDLIGRGFSKHDGSYTIQDHVAQLWEDVVKNLVDKYEEIHICGHSAGGGIAVAFASMYYRDECMQGKLKSVVAVSPTGLLYRPALCLIQNLPVINLLFYPFLMNMHAQRSAWTIDYDKGGGEAGVNESTKKRVVGLQEALHADPDRSTKITNAIWGALEDFPFSNMASEIQGLATKMKPDVAADGDSINFTLVWGSADTVCPIDAAQDWVAIFKDCANFKYVELEGLGHGLVQNDTEVVLEAAGF